MKIHINYIKDNNQEILLINLLEAYGNSVIQKIELDPRLLKELSERIYQQLALFQKKKESSPSNPMVDKEIERDIKYLGKELFTLLFDAIKTEISSSSDKDLILSFDEKLFYTPFEILYDGKDFLCLKYNFTKQVISDGVQAKQSSQKTDKINAVILSNPSLDKDLEVILKEERNNLYDQLKKNKRVNVDPPVVGERITVSYFNDLWDKHLIYYAGHSRSRQSEKTLADSRMNGQLDYGLKLSGDQYLTPQRIEKLDLTHVKLFYVNSCESLLPPGDAEANLFTSFLKSGVENVIGNLMEVHNKPASSFANYFYTYLLNGRTIAEAIRLSRLQSIKEYGYSELIWLVTSFYGDPTWKLPASKMKKIIYYASASILAISIISYPIYLSLNKLEVKRESHLNNKLTHKVPSPTTNKEFTYHDYASGAQIETETFYKNGSSYVIRRIYHFESNQVHVEAPYKDGKLHGFRRFYYKNGKLEGEIPYKNGKMDGIRKLYHKNGHLKYEFPYKNGKQHGVQKGYYENSQLWYELPYVNGKIDGIQKSYHRNGKLSSVHPYNNGKGHGIWKNYGENGQLRKETEYKNGVINGFVIKYDQDGQISNKSLWKNNRLIKQIIPGKK